MTDPLSALVLHVLPGDGVFDPPEAWRYDEILGRDGQMHPVPKGRPLAVTMPVAPGAVVSLEEGTERGERHRVARCTGTGPYMVELGAADVPSRLRFAHTAGTPLRVVQDA